MVSHGNVTKNLDLGTATDLLSRTPSVLLWLLANQPDELAKGGTADDWAPFDTVGHLIHGEIIDWIPRTKIILGRGENRAFEPFDRFAQFEASKGKSIDELLKEFHRVRHESLDELRSMELNDEKLSLTGIHPEFGEVTLSELIASWVAHDMTHIRQIVTYLAKRFGSHVGPWRDYLSILD
jgi:hypothetical protein